MAVHYRLYQNKNQKSDYFQKWYGRAVNMGTVDTDEIAERIQAKCSLTKSDVKACIEAFYEEVHQVLLDGKRAKLGMLGSFKVGITTEHAESPEKFTVKGNIKGVHVVYTPAVKVGSKRLVKALLDGVSIAELPIYTGGKASAQG